MTQTTKEIIKSLFPQYLTDTPEYRVLQEMTAEELSLTYDYVRMFNNLNSMDKIPEKLLFIQGEDVGFQYLPDEPTEAQREILKRWVNIYKDKGSDIDIVRAGRYGNDTNWQGGNLTLYKGALKSEASQIMLARDRIFYLNKSDISGQMVLQDGKVYMQGVIIIRCKNPSPRVTQFLEKTVPAGLRYVYETITSIGGFNEMEPIKYDDYKLSHDWRLTIFIRPQINRKEFKLSDPYSLLSDVLKFISGETHLIHENKIFIYKNFIYEQSVTDKLVVLKIHPKPYTQSKFPDILALYESTNGYYVYLDIFYQRKLKDVKSMTDLLKAVDGYIITNKSSLNEIFFTNQEFVLNNQTNLYEINTNKTLIDVYNDTLLSEVQLGFSIVNNKIMSIKPFTGHALVLDEPFELISFDKTDFTYYGNAYYMTVETEYPVISILNNEYTKQGNISITVDDNIVTISSKKPFSGYTVVIKQYNKTLIDKQEFYDVNNEGQPQVITKRIKNTFNKYPSYGEPIQSPFEVNIISEV